MDNIYLTHHGIKGQKWGIRRFQQKDGSLTQAGRKRYGSSTYEAWVENRKKKAQERAKARAASEAAKREREEAKRKEKVANAYRKKSAGEMTDEELTSAINRARLEDAYRQLRPEQVSAGKAFAKKLLNEAVIPAAVTAGKNWLTKMSESLLKKVLPEEISELAALKNEKELLSLKKDIDDLKKTGEDEISVLKKTKERLSLQKEIDDIKNGKEPELSWADKLKKQTYEKNERAEREAQEARDLEERMARVKVEDEANQILDAINTSVKQTERAAKESRDTAMGKAREEVNTEVNRIIDAINNSVETTSQKTAVVNVVSKTTNTDVNDSKIVSAGKDFVSNLDLDWDDYKEW